MDEAREKHNRDGDYAARDGDWAWDRIGPGEQDDYRAEDRCDRSVYACCTEIVEGATSEFPTVMAEEKANSDLEECAGEANECSG